eukprot:Pgem_evm1s4221
MQFSIINLFLLATAQFAAAEIVQHSYTEGENVNVIVTGDDSVVKRFDGVDGYDCKEQGAVTVRDRSRYVKDISKSFLLLAERKGCPTTVMHVYRVVEEEGVQKLFWNVDFNHFANMNNAPVTFEISASTNDHFSSAAPRAIAKMKKNQHEGMFQQYVDKEITIVKEEKRLQRRGGNLFKKIGHGIKEGIESVKDFTEEITDKIGDIIDGVKDVFSEDGSEQNFSLQIEKDFDFKLDVLDATQKCYGIMANEKVRFWDWKLEILDHYIWIKHGSKLDVGAHFDIYLHYKNNMAFQIADMKFKTFNVTGIATITPTVNLNAQIAGEMNAHIKGRVDTGFYYDDDVTYFDSIGDIIHNPKELLGHPIKKLPALEVHGDIKANADVSFTLDAGAEIKMHINLDKENPLELADGKIGIKSVANIQLVGHADVSADAIWNGSFIPKVQKTEFAGTLTVVGSVNVDAYFNGTILDREGENLTFDLYDYNGTIANIGSKKGDRQTSTGIKEEGAKVPAVYELKQSKLMTIQRKLAHVNHLIKILERDPKMQNTAALESVQQNVNAVTVTVNELELKISNTKARRALSASLTKRTLRARRGLFPITLTYE